MSILTAASFADALRAGRASMSAVDAAALLLGPVDRTYKRDKDGKFGSGGGGGGGKIVTKGTLIRPEFEGLETAEQVSHAAATEAKRITGRDIEFDMTGSDPKIAAEHASGILYGLEKFPSTGLTRVDFGDYNDGGAESYARTTTDGTHITFSRDAQKYGADSYRQDLKNDEQFHHLVRAGGPVGVALHEFGHAVANSHEINGWLDNKAREFTEVELHSEHHGATVAQQISRYAATSSRETSAEAFADAMYNGPNASKLSQHIMSTYEAEVAQANKAKADAAGDEA